MSRTLEDVLGLEHVLELKLSHIKLGHHVKMVSLAGQGIGEALEADRRRRWFEDFDVQRRMLLHNQQRLEQAEAALRQFVLGRMEEAYFLGRQSVMDQGAARMQPTHGSGRESTEDAKATPTKGERP